MYNVQNIFFSCYYFGTIDQRLVHSDDHTRCPPTENVPEHARFHRVSETEFRFARATALTNGRPSRRPPASRNAAVLVCAHVLRMVCINDVTIGAIAHRIRRSITRSMCTCVIWSSIPSRDVNTLYVYTERIYIKLSCVCSNPFYSLHRIYEPKSKRSILKSKMIRTTTRDHLRPLASCA